jgi:hypothetical protein
LDYCREVGQGITKEEAKFLVQPRILMPIQQELMDWHNCLYHLSFHKVFWLAEKGFLPKGLLTCKGMLPLCIACQFGAAHCCPWRTHGKSSGLICCPEHILPGNGISVDQILSAQPGLIPQMSGFRSSQRIWGCTTFCDHVSDLVYVHLMRDFTVDKTILALKAFEKVMVWANCNKGFLDKVNRKDQKIMLCAVGAHHQKQKQDANTISQNSFAPQHMNVAADDQQDVLALRL